MATAAMIRGVPSTASRSLAGPRDRRQHQRRASSTITSCSTSKNTTAAQSKSTAVKRRGILSPRIAPAGGASSSTASVTTAAATGSSSSGGGDDADVVVIGSGVGGLTAAALLAYYGKKVIVLESHYATGGAAHGFSRKTEHGEFKFDTGPSFFAGLTTPNALNPLAAVLQLLGEPLDTVKYDPLGTFHIEAGKPGLKRHADMSKLVAEVQRFSPDGARQLDAAVPKIRTMYEALSQLPTPALRADWKVGVMIVSRYMKAMAGLGPYAPVLPNPTVGLLDFLSIKDPWMRRLADLECYLLSGGVTHV